MISCIAAAFFLLVQALFATRFATKTSASGQRLTVCQPACPRMTSAIGREGIELLSQFWLYTDIARCLEDHLLSPGGFGEVSPKPQYAMVGGEESNGARMAEFIQGALVQTDAPISRFTTIRVEYPIWHQDRATPAFLITVSAVYRVYSAHLVSVSLHIEPCPADSPYKDASAQRLAIPFHWTASKL